MSRKSNRISRSLIVVLLLTLGLGVFAYFHKTARTTAEPVDPRGVVRADDGATQAHSTPAVPKVGVMQPLTTVTPTTVTPTPNSLNSAPSSATPSLTHTTPVRPVSPTPLSAASSNSQTSTHAGATVTTPSGAIAQASRPALPAEAPAPPASESSSPMPPSSASDAASLLDIARTQIDSGDLLKARASLNSAYTSNQLNRTDADRARQMIAEVSQVVYFSPKRFADDPFGGTYIVAPGDNLAKIGAKYDVTSGFLQRLNGISDPRKLRAGQTIKVVKGPFHAVVSKKDFTLDIFFGPPGERGSMFVTRLMVGLGKDDSTPTGTWVVRPGGKLKNPKFWGAGGLPPMEADDPKNPLGEYWIALEGMDGQAVGQTGYGIHGTIEPNSIGTEASLGCIRLKDDDISLVYDLLVDGKSTVMIRP